MGRFHFDLLTEAHKRPRWYLALLPYLYTITTTHPIHYGIIINKVVVAADGIYSTLRSQKAAPTDSLRYLGVVVILGISEGLMVEATAEDRVQVQWLDGETRVFCMPFDKRRTMWQLSFPVEEEEEAIEISASPESLRGKALALCGAWPPSLVRVVVVSLHRTSLLLLQNLCKSPNVDFPPLQSPPSPQLLQATSLTDVSGHPVYDRDILEAGSAATRSLFGVRKKVGVKSKITFVGDAAHPMVSQRVIYSLSIRLCWF